MILLLKGMGLERFLLSDFGMEFLLLNKKPVTVEADELLPDGFRVA